MGFFSLFKSKEESINVETMLVNKIHELQIENDELRAKLAPFYKKYENDTDDEKLSIKHPIYDYEDEKEEDEEEEEDDDEKRTNNLTDSFSEELNFGRM